MPVLGLFLFSVFSAFAEWLLKYFTQKMAVAAALVALAVGLWISMYALMRGAIMIALVTASTTHPMFAVGISTVISPHTSTLISSYFTLWAAANLYHWKFNIIGVWSRTI